MRRIRKYGSAMKQLTSHSHSIRSFKRTGCRVVGFLNISDYMKIDVNVHIVTDIKGAYNR